jgi:hypothetical protein
MTVNACRLEDATTGNTQQLEATRGNLQRSEVNLDAVHSEASLA